MRDRIIDVEGYAKEKKAADLFVRQTDAAKYS